MNEAQCEKCRYWASYPEFPEMGQCRKRAPVSYVDRRVGDPLWPNVAKTDWCGEFDINPKMRACCYCNRIVCEVKPEGEYETRDLGHGDLCIDCARRIRLEVYAKYEKDL